MAKRFVEEAMLNILNRAGNPVNSGKMPALIQHLRSINMLSTPNIPNPPAMPNPLAGVAVPVNVAAPKRAPRGLTYPGAKPTKSPLYKFLH